MSLRSVRNSLAAVLLAACADLPADLPEGAMDLEQTEGALVSGVDLRATLTGPATLNAGASGTFTATINNNGTAKAYTAALQSTVPAGYGVTPGTGCSFNTTSRLLYCGMNTLASGATRQFTYTLTAPLAAGVLSQSMSATSTSIDVNTSNNFAALSTTVLGADLGVTLSAPVSAPAGSSIATLVTATNTGVLAGSSVWVTIPVPQGTYPTAWPGCSLASFPTRVRCNLGTVAPGATVTRNLTWGVPYNATSVALTASVAGSVGEPALTAANNTATATVALTALAPVPVALSLPAPQAMFLVNCFGDPGWFGSFAACPNNWRQNGVITFLDGGVVDTGDPDVTGTWLQPTGADSLEFEFHDALTGDLLMVSEGFGVSSTCFEGLNYWPGDPQGLNRGAFRICTQ